MDKKKYTQPLINRVIIDQGISLQLDSLMDPGEEPVTKSNMNYFNDNPFKINTG